MRRCSRVGRRAARVPTPRVPSERRRLRMSRQRVDVSRAGARASPSPGSGRARRSLERPSTVHVRPRIGAARIGGVMVYRVEELKRFLTSSGKLRKRSNVPRQADDDRLRRARCRLATRNRRRRPASRFATRLRRRVRKRRPTGPNDIMELTLAEQLPDEKPRSEPLSGEQLSQVIWTLLAMGRTSPKIETLRTRIRANPDPGADINDATAPCIGGCGRLIRPGSRCRECTIPRPGNTAAWRSTRNTILARDNYRCHRCGGFADQVDHLAPVSQRRLEHRRQPRCDLRTTATRSKRDGAR